RVDAGASRHLTGRIYQLQAKIDALQQRPESWTEVAPPGAAPPPPALTRLAAAKPAAARGGASAAPSAVDSRGPSPVKTPLAAPPVPIPAAAAGPAPAA